MEDEAVYYNGNKITLWHVERMFFQSRKGDMFVIGGVTGKIHVLSSLTNLFENNSLKFICRAEEELTIQKVFNLIEKLEERRVRTASRELQQRETKQMEDNLKEMNEATQIVITPEQAKVLHATSTDVGFKNMLEQNFTAVQLGIELEDTWENLESISGWCTDGYSKVLRAINNDTTQDHKNVFKTKEQAEASIALAMLSQLMAQERYNGNWKPDWGNSEESKYAIYFQKEKINKDFFETCSQFLAFPTPKKRDQFLENHRDLILKAKPFL